MSDMDIPCNMELSILDYLDHRPSPPRPRCFDAIPTTDQYKGLSVLGMDVWRYHLLLFCDLSSLLRISWLNSSLRRLLHDSAFVVEYQDACWFLEDRICRCPRNIFYLNVREVLDFTYEYTGKTRRQRRNRETEREEENQETIDSIQDAVLLLRRMGRTPDMLTQSFQRSGQPPTRSPLPVKRLDPQRSPLFGEGLASTWVDECIIPVPRSMTQPVDQRRLDSVGLHLTTREQLTTESVEEFSHRTFWRGFHEITDAMLYEAECGRDPMGACLRDDQRTSHGYGPVRPDLLDEWKEHCVAVGRDPYDPLYDDDECRGFRCIRWVRERMFDSAVGGTCYPLELCLSSQRLSGTAARLGVDYLDRMYIHLHRYTGGSPDWTTMEHRGPLYLMGVRYEHASEDFCGWVLNTMALMHSVYGHMWLDGMVQWNRMVMSHLHHLAEAIEEDMPFLFLQARWRFLHTLCFGGPSMAAPRQPYTERQRRRDQEAIHLIFNNHHLAENRYLSNLVQSGDTWTNVGDVAQRSRHYMTSLLEQHDRPPNSHRTESERIHDATRLIRFAEYMTDFAEFVAPRVDDRTLTTRRRTLRLFLSSYVSMVMFSPGWKRVYHWKPSRTHEETHWHVPRINPRHNHRFNRYQEYCNRRTLFYHPDPSLLLHNNPTGDATYGWRG